MPPRGGEVAARQTSATDFLVFNAFETMDTQRARQALPIHRLAWCENLQILADNQLKVVPGPNAALANIMGKQFTTQFYAFYNNTDYIIAFAADGSAYQIQINNGTAVQFAPPGTFSTAPDMTLWQSQRILIADPIAGYCTWDGSAFAQSGTISPVITVTAGGSGYVTPPSVTISGGSGSGATAVATITGGVVTAVTVTNAGTGYKAGDTLTVTFGTGAATATAKVWPVFSTPPVTTLAVFQGRVWLGGGRVLTWTGTGGFDDSNPADASGSTTISDADLVHFISGLRALNNYLYIFGDNSIKQIGQISVTGSTTNFSIITLASDLGTIFPRTIQSFNRLVLFANKVGVYAIFGASVEKISDPMDGIFAATDFTQPLQGAIADINAQRTYLLLLRYIDPQQGTRSLILSFSAKRWYVQNQSSSLLSLCWAPIGGIIENFGSSGPDITQIIQNINQPMVVLLRTALADHQKPYLQKRAIRWGVGQNVVGVNNVTLTVDSESGSTTNTYMAVLPVVWLNAAQQVVTWINAIAQVVIWVGSGFFWRHGQAAGTGLFLGLTLSGTFTGLSFQQFVIEYQEATLMRSRPSE